MAGATAMAIPEPREPDHSSSGFGDFHIGLLQSILHEAFLALDLEAAVSVGRCKTVADRNVSI